MQQELRPKKRRRDKRYWTKAFFLRRSSIIFKYSEGAPDHQNFMRLELPMFNEVLARIGPEIQKEGTGS